MNRFYCFCILISISIGASNLGFSTDVKTSFYLVESFDEAVITTYDKQLLDSILPSYHSSTDDSLRLSILENLGKMLSNEIALKYADLLFKKAQKDYLNANTIVQKKVFNYYRIMGLITMADIYLVSGNDSIGQKCIQKSFDLQKEMVDSLSLAKCLYMRASRHRQHEVWAKAVLDYDRCLAVSRQLKDTSMVAMVYYEFGLMYHVLRDIEKAAYYLKRSIDCQKHTKDETLISLTYTILMSMFMDSGYMKEAGKYIDQCIALSSVLKDQYHSDRTELVCVVRKGIWYMKEKKYEEAIIYLEQGIEMAGNSSDEYFITQKIVALAFLGDIYRLLNKAQKSKNYYLNSLAQSEPLNNKLSTFFAYKGLSKLYAQKGDYQQAIKTAKLGFNAVKGRRKRLEKIKSIALLLNGFYEKIQLTDSAYHYYKIYTNASDSIKKQQSLLAVQKLKFSFEIDQMKKIALIKQSKIELLEKENQTKKLIMIGGGVGALLLIVVLFLIFNHVKREKELVNSKLKLTELKKEQLKNDLEFNQLNLQRALEQVKEKNKLVVFMKEKLKMEGTYTIAKKDAFTPELLKIDIDWADFTKHFEKIYPGFLQRVQQNFPQLTVTDLKMCALIKLNYSTKEIADIMNITMHGAYKSRKRLRAKFRLTSEESLERFLSGMHRVESVVV